MIAVIDYGMGNTRSVLNAFEYLGEDAQLCCSTEDVLIADRLVLPGVGAFPDCMRALRKSGLVDALKDKVLVEKVPFLGICLGMQVLASRGEESGGDFGLGWLDAAVQKLRPKSSGTKIPNVGWEDVVIAKPNPLFNGLKQSQDYYFVHSFHMVCNDPQDVTSYYPMEDSQIVASVQKDNIFGVQFHPERSSRPGLELLVNFLEY